MEKNKHIQTSLCRNLKVCGRESALTSFKVNFQNMDGAFFSSCILHLVLLVWAEIYLCSSRRQSLPRQHLALLHPQSPTRSRLLITLPQSIYLTAFHFYVWYLVAPATLKYVFALLSIQSAKNSCPVAFKLPFKCNLDVIISPRLYLLTAKLY